MVVRLSRLAYAGLAFAVAGALLGLYAEFRGVPGCLPYSRALVGIGILLYVVARWRQMRRSG